MGLLCFLAIIVTQVPPPPSPLSMQNSLCLFLIPLQMTTIKLIYAIIYCAQAPAASPPLPSLTPPPAVQEAFLITRSLCVASVELQLQSSSLSRCWSLHSAATYIPWRIKWWTVNHYSRLRAICQEGKIVCPLIQKINSKVPFNFPGD